MNGFRVSAAVGRACKLCLLAYVTFFTSMWTTQAMSIGSAHTMGRARSLQDLVVSAQAAPRTGGACDTTGKNEITIACDYAETPASTANAEGEPRITLNRAEISFKTKVENSMRVELTFTNRSAVSDPEARSVYLSIDNDAGQNLVRRVLPHVDFRKLEPGKRVTFSDRLLIGVLRPGEYTVHLWIPSPDPALKFDPAKNLMLSNVAVPDKQTGLNTLATFAIVQ